MNTTRTLSRNLALAFLLGIGGIALLSTYFGIAIELALLVVAGAVGLFYLAGRFPEALLVAVAFAPQWKKYWPMNIVDRAADITLVAALCLGFAVAWRLLGGRLSKSWSLQQYFFQQSGPLLAYALFAMILSFSYTYTTAPSYGSSKLSRFLLIGSLLLLAPCFLIISEMEFRRFVIIFVAMAGITALELIAHLEHRTDVNADITRIGDGWLMGMAIMLLLFYPVFAKKSAQIAFVGIFLPLIAGGLIATAARGAVVALVPMVAVGAFVWFKQGRLRAVTVLVLLALLIGSGVGAYFVLRGTDSDKYSSKTSELLALSSGQVTSGSGGKRLAFYEATIRAIPDHLLFGKGIGSWGLFYYGMDERNYPHNLVLEMLFEEGFVGFGAFVFVLLSLAVSSASMLRLSRFHFLAIPMILTYTVAVSMFSGDLDDNRLIWLWAGLTLAACRMVALHHFHKGRVASPQMAISRRRRLVSAFPASSTPLVSAASRDGGLQWR